MGLFDKLKDIFSEEVEEQPIKKDMIQVEISTPKNEEELVSDNDALRAEKPKVPVYFDDKDFDTLEKPKEKPKTSYGLKEVVKEEPKIFRASPIISPVYGVLDKNYHKEDIRNKGSEDVKKNVPVSIDDVRKKAFGTLEDDIETDLLQEHNMVIEELDNEIKSDLFDDLDFNLDGVLDEPRHGKKDIELDYVIDIPKHEDIMEDMKEQPTLNEIEEEVTKMVSEEKINKDDLFDLIDSMYVDKENE